MRFMNVALITGAVVLGACGGAKKEDATPVTPPPAAATTPAPAAGGAAVGTAAPITGKTIEVKMIGDEKGYRFEPSAITAKAGDAIKFTVVSMVPHNVAFDAATIPADVKAQLDANFGTSRASELSSTLLTTVGDSFTLSLGGIKPGTYAFFCTPHIAMNMKGTITVQ
jgi:plastocyanin